MNDEILSLLHASSHAIAFTGAGVSTLSGIPDFRGKNGLYQNPENEKIFSLEVFLEDPSLYYRSCASMLYAEHHASASLVHRQLAAWESEGLLKALITQNIDCLHQAAGSKRVMELHGSPDQHHCLSCGEFFDYPTMKKRVQAGDIPPRCACGGSIKPDITFFGENLPEEAFSAGMTEAYQADLILVLGTSLTVFPAAQIPLMAVKEGAKLIIVNDQETSLDSLAALVLRSLEEAFA